MSGPLAPSHRRSEMAAMLTPQQVAAEFNCSAETVRRLCKSGRLRAMRLGDSWRISPEAVAAYREHQTVQPASPVVTASAPATSPAVSAGALPDLPADYVPVFPELWHGHVAQPATGRSRSADTKKARSVRR